MNEKNKMTCPGCSQSEEVKKLSVFYAESLVNSADKTKSEELGPPVKPKFNGLAEKYIAASQNIVMRTESSIGCLTAMLVYFVTLALPIILWFYIVLRISYAIVGVPFDTEAQLPSGGLFLAILLTLLFLPPAILVYFGWRKRQPFNQEHLPSWLASLEEWSKQYYCKQCDQKFIPESSMAPEPFEINWKRLAITKEEDKTILEKALNSSLGIAREDHCQVCNEKISGIYFSSKDYRNMSIAALQKIKKEALVCPECHAVYCKKCKNKALGYTIGNGFSNAVCQKCKAAIPEQDVLIGTKGWYDSLPKMSDIEKVVRPESQ